MAQQYAARIVSRRGQAVEEKEEAVVAGADYQRVDLATLEVIRPRSVGAERVALAAVQQLGYLRPSPRKGKNKALLIYGNF